MRRFSQSRQVEQLPRKIIDATEKNQGQLIGMQLDCLQDIVFPDQPFTLPRFDLDNRIVRVEAVIPHLGFQQVAI
jgi:hypothetical protein